MEVVSVADGKNLGRVCDAAFIFPEGKIKGFYVTGCKGFKFTKSDEFIPLRDIVKIGEDVILVKPAKEEPPKNNCPPPNGCCPPPCDFKPDPRRNYDDYE